MEPRSIDIDEKNKDNEISQLLELKDPLADVDSYTQMPTYYRYTETIFAEPIINDTVETAVDGHADEICFIDNIVVHKRPGRRQKYLMNVDMYSSSVSSVAKCPQTNCTKSFSSMTLLRGHIRKVHCGDRNKFICEHCGSGFSAKYLLQRHMVVHTGEKVECPICGKTLSKRTNLSVHLRWHSDARTHICPVCRRCFVRRATLDTHLRFVHGSGDLRCRTCNERFPSRKMLATHKSCSGRKSGMDSEAVQ